MLNVSQIVLRVSEIVLWLSNWRLCVSETFNMSEAELCVTEAVLILAKAVLWVDQSAVRDKKEANRCYILLGNCLQNSNDQILFQHQRKSRFLYEYPSELLNGRETDVFIVSSVYELVN